MKQTTNQLINDLIDRTKAVMNTIDKFQNLSEEELNWKENPNSWSVLECIEHLNLYGDFYLPELQKRIQAAPKSKQVNFRSGWLGNYLATSMLPKEQLNKMKTFKDKDPSGSTLSKSVLERFVEQEKTLLELLHTASEMNLTKVRTATTLPLIKLRLGDTLRFVIYHHQRHIVQAERVLNMLKQQKNATSSIP